MKKSYFSKILLAFVFALISFSAHGRIFYRYELYFDTKVFAKPSYDSELLGRLGEDEIIETEYSDLESPWVEIPYEGGIGYVARRELIFIREVRTGKDDFTYNNKLDMVAEKIGHPCSEQTTLILTAIAALLSLIAIFLPRIKGNGGWISGFCALAISLLIQTYVALCCGYLPDIGLGNADLFIYPVLLILVYKAAQAVYYGISNFKGVEVQWSWGLLLAVVGGACLYANRVFSWNVDDKILIGFAIAQVLFSAYIAIRIKSSLAIPTAISWLVLSFVIMNLTYVTVPAILIILTVLVTLLVLGSIMSACGIFGGQFFVTTSGTILKSIFGGGYVDLEGNTYHDVGGGRVAKD